MKIFLSALLGVGAVVAIIYSSPASKAARTPEDYPLVCRGGGSLVIGIAPGEGNIGFSFTRGTKPAGDGLAPGECSWKDRGMYPNEPDRVSQHVEGGSDSLKVGGTLAPENRWYEDLHSTDSYWTFMVSNNRLGQLIATSARPNVEMRVSPTARVPEMAERQGDEFYAQRERNASREIRQQLEQFRREIREQNLSYTVGYTTAMDRNMDELAGTSVPDDLADQYRGKNALLGWNRNTDSQNVTNMLVVPASFQSSYSCSAAAASFDWRDQGKVSPVRDQLGCGGCWAFATLGAFEGSYLLRSGVSDTSEQDLLSCSGAGTCKGGFWAYDYMIKTGTTTEASAPFTATTGICKSVPRLYKAESWGFVPSKVPVGFAEPSPPEVAELKKALCRYGPISVALLATPKMIAYTGGVFKEDLPDSVRYGKTADGKLKTFNANHGVTLIGWDDNLGAWLIKNSWGTGWGEWAGPGLSTERGYGLIAYGSNNIGLGAAWVVARPLGPGLIRLPIFKSGD